MKREELTELHYITPITNIPSVLQHGILPHNKVRKIPHESVAKLAIQERRRRVAVPGGRRLHDYTNLYFDARNPMMSACRENHEKLCVLRISHEVLDLADVVVADRNASTNYVRFAPAPEGLAIVDKDLVFAEWWTHPDYDQFESSRRKAVKCAEVLVPDKIDLKYVLGAYVSCVRSQLALLPVIGGLKTDINAHLFFR